MSKQNMSRTASSSDKLKKWSPYIDTKVGFLTPRTDKSKHPFVQDTLNRLTSPYKRNNLKFTNSPRLTDKSSPSSAQLYPNISQNSGRPVSSRKSDSPNIMSYRAPDSFQDFVDQESIETNLKDSLVTLKMVIREHEEKMQEKKVLQKVVDQLKSQTEGMRGRKVKFSKNFEKLHKERLMMSEHALSKENERVLIGKNIEQTRDGVTMFEREIKESIAQNLEVANEIQNQQKAILNIREEIAELKKALPIVTKEKEKMRSELQISSKLLQNLEEKYSTLMKEKNAYLHHIDNSNMLKH